MKVSSHDQLHNSIMKIPDSSIGGGGKGILNPQFIVTGTTNFTIPVGFNAIAKANQAFEVADSDFLVNGYPMIPKPLAVDPILSSAGGSLQNCTTILKVPPNVECFPGFQFVNGADIKSFASKTIPSNTPLPLSTLNWWLNNTGSTQTVFHRQFVQFNSPFGSHQFSYYFMGSISSALPVPVSVQNISRPINGQFFATFNMSAIAVPNGTYLVVAYTGCPNPEFPGTGHQSSIINTVSDPDRNPNSIKGLRLREGDVISGGRYVVELYQI